MSGAATLGRDSVLEIRLDHLRPHGRHATVPVIAARRLRGRIGRVKVHGGAYHAVPVHTARGLSVRITAR
ncbi:hypothetical protein SAMN05421874_101446 [Nonomuraea maritima]|uniref:Uncharacterized protein n=1 Tax=Nonomuraea maritima TaxID=683260 RepID=A0A1G8STP0_9ACTN|nr:hypothetical protein [Nonomuraea maritima]SDJ32544.1 hypothetical protein SAMN05421874_101446 [Nonomuraea maritima]